MALERITQLLLELDSDNLVGQVRSSLESHVDPQDVLDALTRGMDLIGKRYESGEYFLTELVLAGETMKDAFEILKPHLTATGGGRKGPVILATVKGDNHDIGKNILNSMLVSAGIDVIDLGVDCPAEKIVGSAKDHGAKVIGLSSLLTTTMNEIATVHESLTKENIRNNVKLIVGGAPLSLELAKEFGADDYGADAMEGVRKIRDLLE